MKYQVSRARNLEPVEKRSIETDFKSDFVSKIVLKITESTTAITIGHFFTNKNKLCIPKTP